MLKRALIVLSLTSAVLFLSCGISGEDEPRTHYSVAIVGGGIAGFTAGVYAIRSNYTTIIFDGGESALESSPSIENWPGEIDISGEALIKKLQDHAEHSGCKIESSWISEVDFSKKPYVLTTRGGKKYTADSVIISTGTRRKRLGCPGEEEYWGHGVSACATCDAPLYKGKTAIVVGGGNTAMTEANHLARFADKVLIANRSPELRRGDFIQKKALGHKNVSVLLNTTVKEIKGKDGIVTSVTIENSKTKEVKDIPIDGVFLAIGVLPNSEIFSGKVELNKWGYIKNDGGPKTSVAGVFWCGDVGHSDYQQAAVAAGEGCKAAIDCAHYLDFKNGV
jgi:thioredoxin reductase (NADPH)